MKTFGKIFGLLLLFFIVLCITIKERPVFAYLYDLVSPATRYAQNAAEGFFAKSVSETQSYSKKLFDNSDPRFRDRVHSKLSSARKAAGEPAEKITEEEKDQLDQLIKNH